MATLTTIDSNYLKQYKFNFANELLNGSLTQNNSSFCCRIETTCTTKIDYENVVQVYNDRVNESTVFEKATSPLPIAVRYISKNNYIYIEKYPFQKTVDLSNNLRKQYINKDDKITVWVPWTLTKICLSNPTAPQIYYSYDQLRNENDHYISGLFPNSYSDGSICYGHSTSLYPEIFLSHEDIKDRPDIRNIYNILFNEYFDAGWNSDLTSILYNTLHMAWLYGTHDWNQFPTIYKFCFPTKEYVTEKLSHISKARRNKITDITQQSGHIRQHLYILYMMSTFNLEEMLTFCKELTQLKQFYSDSHFKIPSINSFSEILNLEKNSYYSTNPTIPSNFDQNVWSNVSNRVPTGFNGQESVSLSSKLELEDTGLTLSYIFYYNVPQHYFSLHSWNPSFYIKFLTTNHAEKTALLFKDCAKNHGDKDNIHFYAMCAQTGNWEKFIVSEKEFKNKLFKENTITYPNSHVFQQAKSDILFEYIQKNVPHTIKVDAKV